MRSIAILAGALALAMPLAAGAKPAPGIAAAVADGGRPAEDKARDELRKPAEMLAFAGVRPGMKIGELLPGGGYFSRVFAKAVGPRGKVYAYVPGEGASKGADRFAPITAAYRNTVRVRGATFKAPEPLDLVWTSQNYHDLKARAASNAEVFAALKPGGFYLIEDHRAAPGAGASVVSTLHRIDEATVIAEVEKAGFVLADESMALRRTDDDHSAKPWEIHDKTDQFVLKFVKPKK